ncbi:MAG TPA: efflux RND transporter periplasmic adaptor subunit [Candidatus Acidoferrales bacterium]|nr:efflux RND transporter periplasmic adaptor subunit [Candidatus Acidoferrales bacterium]
MKSRRSILVVVISVLLIGTIIVLRLRSHAMVDGDAGSSTIAVTVSKAEPGSVTNKINVTGALEGVHETDIISETSGKITKINAEIEAYVSVNSSVAEVENDLQEIAVEAAHINSDKAAADLKRVRNLFTQNAVSETQFENAEVGAKAALAQLKLAQKNYDNTFLRTPIAGRLAQKFVVVGQMITPGTKVATVVDDSRMKLKVGIPENYVSFVKPGSDVQVTSDAVPNLIFSGTIKTIALKADPQTRTFQAEIELLNDRNRSLKSGMFAKAEIATSDGGVASLVIPAVAIIESNGNSPAVFAVKDSVASLKHVTLGRRNDSVVEVLSGLTCEDLVVSFGQQNLKDGTKVKYNVEN